MGLVRSIIRTLDPLVGPAALATLRARGKAPILLYHRVSPGAGGTPPALDSRVFRQHCRVLQAHFTPVPLADLVGRLRRGRSVRGLCAVTFDDGYRDFLEHALPILREFGIPTTNFLVLECLRTGRPPWDARLLRVLEAIEPERLRDAGFGTARGSALERRLVAMESREREAWLSEREAALEGTAPEPRMIRTSDVERAEIDGVEWGCHTVHHPILEWCASESRVQHEVRDARRFMGELLGGPPRFLSYPRGSAPEVAVAVARSAGYEAALAVGQRAVSASSDPWALGRIDVTDRPASMLRLELSGWVEAGRRVRTGFAGGSR